MARRDPAPQRHCVWGETTRLSPLAAHDLDVDDAVVATWADGAALECFYIRAAIEPGGHIGVGGEADHSHGAIFRAAR
jgi:hypothetical protein